MENISKINPYDRMLSWNKSSSNSRRRKIRRRSFNRRSQGRFYALTRLASDIHQSLIEKGSPIRLCVYGDEDNMFMDVVTMDKTDKISQSFTRPINNESLKTVAKRVHNQMGLILDYSV